MTLPDHSTRLIELPPFQGTKYAVASRVYKFDGNFTSTVDFYIECTDPQGRRYWASMTNKSSFVAALAIAYLEETLEASAR